MNSQARYPLFPDAPFGSGRMSFSLFSTIDRGIQRAETSELRSSGSLPCQRSFVSALRSVSTVALSSARTIGFYHVEWARFRRAKPFFSTPGGRDSHARLGAFSIDKNIPILSHFYFGQSMRPNLTTRTGDENASMC